MRAEPAMVRVHTLLRIAGEQTLRDVDGAPEWLAPALARASWVVVRRPQARGTLLPVGVRGAHRSQRLAAWLARADIIESVAPLQLARRRAWAAHPRRTATAALAALDAVAAFMAEQGLARYWGPVGSVGFELASGMATVTRQSDLDVMVQPPTPLTVAAAAALLRQLARVPVRVDVLLETRHGAVALADYAQGRAPFLLRTPAGARLVADPWARCAAA